jgi:serine/threonine protein kinase
LIATEWIRPGAVGFDRERSPTDSAKITVGIALAMAYLHSQNVLHRDLKPANVLIDEVDCPHICDVGLSKACGFDATQSANLSTPLSMAPEMHTEDHYGPAVDVFAWACTAYEVITGKHVLEGITLFQVAKAARKRRSRPPIPPEWSQEFAGLMRRVWAVKPNDRPSFIEIHRVFEKCSYQLWKEINTSAVHEFVSDIQQRAAAC